MLCDSLLERLFILLFRGAGFYFRRQLIMRFFCGSCQRKRRKIYTPCRVLTACEAAINLPVFESPGLSGMVARDNVS